MTTKTTVLRRVSAGVGAIALALVGVGAFGTAANAAVGPDQPDHPTTGSLTLHKRVGQQGNAGTGNELDDPTGDPLGGVVFTAQEVGVVSAAGACTVLDLSVAASWDSVPTGGAMPSLVTPSVDDAGKLCAFDAIRTSDPTDATTGITTFSNLPLRLYRVHEQSAPPNVVSTTPDFFVTVPLPNGGDWNYNVHAYPKNQTLGAPTKTVNATDAQTGFVAGSTVEWTITQTVPALNAGETYNSASIWDVLNPCLTDPTVTSFTNDGTPITDYSQTTASGKTTWALGTTAKEGLTAGDVLTLKFTTKVNCIPESGAIPNSSYGSEFNGKSVPPTVTPYTYWGVLKLTKVGVSGQATKPLAGAKFEVYPKGDGSCAATPPDNKAGLVSTGTSGADGVVTWSPNSPTNNSSPLGLFVANSPNGPLTSPTKSYCVYETVVPSGYTGVPVQAVTITPGTTLTAGTNDLTVRNTPKEGPNLPLTGSTGTLAMSIGGLALVAIGAGAILLSRRNRREHADQ